MNIVTVYVGRAPWSLTRRPSSRAGQPGDRDPGAVSARLDEVSRQLSTAEIEDFVKASDVMTVVQRLEMVGIGLEIDYDAVELGTDGPSVADCSLRNCSAATTPRAS